MISATTSSRSLLNNVYRVGHYLLTAWIPPMISDLGHWAWGRRWRRRLALAAMLMVMGAALIWLVLWWQAGQQRARAQQAVAEAGAPTTLAQIPVPALTRSENGATFLRAALAAVARPRRGFYVLDGSADSFSHLQDAALSDAWDDVSGADKAEALAGLEQPQWMVAWELVHRAALTRGIAFPPVGPDEPSMLMSLLPLHRRAQLHVRLLADAQRLSEARTHLHDLVRLDAITTPTPDLVSLLGWWSALSSDLTLLKYLALAGQLDAASAQILEHELAILWPWQESLVNACDGERIGMSSLFAGLARGEPFPHPPGTPAEGNVPFPLEAVSAGLYRIFYASRLGGPWRDRDWARSLSASLAIRHALITSPLTLDPSISSDWSFLVRNRQRMDRQVIQTRCALALVQHRLAAGSYPQDLSELGREFPAWLRYTRNATGAILEADEDDKSQRKQLTWRFTR